MTFEASEIDGLYDAYTGAPMRVVMEPTPRGVLFSAPSATSPRVFRASEAEARRVLGDSCPYTGERFRPLSVDGMTVFLGGFDPARPRPRAEFLALARMRNGESPVSRDTPSRVEAVPERAPAPLSREVPVTQEAVDAALSLTEPRRSGRRKGR